MAKRINICSGVNVDVLSEHPIRETNKALKVLKRFGETKELEIDVITNSPNFIETIFNVGVMMYGFEFYFYVNGVEVNSIDDIFKEFNESYDIINKILDDFDNKNKLDKIIHDSI